MNGLFLVFHSMACAFFLLFLRIWMSMPHWKRKKRKTTTRNKKKKTCFQTVEGGGLRVSTTLIRDVESEILPEDHPDTPLHLNIQQCVMLTEKQLTQKCPVLSAMCVTHLACEKAACLLYFCFNFFYSSVSIWNLFLYQYLIIGLILF